MTSMTCLTCGQRCTSATSHVETFRDHPEGHRPMVYRDHALDRATDNLADERILSRRPNHRRDPNKGRKYRV